MTPYKVLGRYVPPKWRAWQIGKDLTKLTASLGYVPLVDKHIKQNKGAAWYDESLHAEVRKTAVPFSEGTDWHQDGDTSSGANMDHVLVLWSNKSPTEFRVGDNVYVPDRFQVVAAKNLACVHRRAPEVEGRRWSFRQRMIG